jgi:hypothetical protein
MSKTNIDQLILRMESYLECWKQFNNYMNIARSKKFGPEDENQFLEIKSVLTQELELLLSSIDCAPITREEVHGLIGAAPSVRYVSEMNDSNLRNMENAWHKLFIGWQSILGQLKVRQGHVESKGFMSSLFRGKAA